MTSLIMISGKNCLLFSMPELPFVASMTLKYGVKIVLKKKRNSALSSTINKVSLSVLMLLFVSSLIKDKAPLA